MEKCHLFFGLVSSGLGAILIWVIDLRLLRAYGSILGFFCVVFATFGSMHGLEHLVFLMFPRGGFDLKGI